MQLIRNEIMYFQTNKGWILKRLCSWNKSGSERQLLGSFTQQRTMNSQNKQNGKISPKHKTIPKTKSKTKTLNKAKS